MLCAKYDYKMDIAVKQEEAFEDGMEKGSQLKAIETAKNAIKLGLNTDQISKITGLSFEEISNLKNE